MTRPQSPGTSEPLSPALSLGAPTPCNRDHIQLLRIRVHIPFHQLIPLSPSQRLSRGPLPRHLGPGQPGSADDTSAADLGTPAVAGPYITAPVVVSSAPFSRFGILSLVQQAPSYLPFYPPKPGSLLILLGLVSLPPSFWILQK